MDDGTRKLEISLSPTYGNPEDKKNPYFYIVLEWHNRPCYDGDNKIVPGTEKGCWSNTGICGWAATPVIAFAEANTKLMKGW